MSTVSWPQDFQTTCCRIDGAYTFAASAPDGRLTYLGQGDTNARAEDVAWACYELANSCEHVHDFDPRDRQDGSGWCRTCGVIDTHAFERRRTVDHGRHALTRPWPEHWLVQGSGGGLVVRRDRSTYRTAFFEVFPDEPSTFVRGEGATLTEAEDAAWEQVQRIVTCPQHEFETRGYTNGAGLCRHCDLFASGVFDVADVGVPCVVCGERTNYSQVAGSWYCRRHAPSREQRVRLRAQAAAASPDGASGDHPLAEMLDELAADEKP